MPTLQIAVIDPPSEFTGYTDIRLLLQGPEAYTPPTAQTADAIVFDVPFDLKPDRAGTLQPTGPFVQRQNDGRRFVYLAWCGTQGATVVMFRRLKVFFDTVQGFPGLQTEYRLKVQGKDKKGAPACATAHVLPP